MFSTISRRFDQISISFALRRDQWMPFILLGLSIVAYGLLIPWLTHYWDDWPKVLFIETIGPQSFSSFAAHRPLNGRWYQLFTALLGSSPMAWHLLALFWRWASALAFWAFLKKCWPARTDFDAWSAMLFLLYPAFTQQSISLSYYIHFLANTGFFLSLFFTAWALRDHLKSAPYHAIAWTLSLLTMLTTDYFYGLELIRPLMIFIILRSPERTPADRLKASLKHWLPYLLLVLVLFAWRSTLAAPEAYQVSLFENLFAGPAPQFKTMFASMFGDLWEGSLLAWFHTLSALASINFSSMVSLFALLIIFPLALLLYLLFKSAPAISKKLPARNANRESLLFAFAALFLANIPAWASGLQPSLFFPADRLNLAMAAGASMLLVSLIFLILQRRKHQVLTVVLLVALASSMHVQIANSYREDGEAHSAFWHQFTWRVPSLAPRTAVLTQQLPLKYVSDDSLTGAMNLIYPSPKPSEELNAALLYLDLRLGSKVPSLEEGQSIAWSYRLIDFSGNTSQTLLLYHAPPACLRILHPIYDQGFPLLPQSLRLALPLSKPSLISTEGGIPAQLPPQFFPPQSSDSWCYFFEKADLARQQGDWLAVALLGDKAFALDDSPNHASERIPFIEAYALTGEWDKALLLSRETIQINAFMQTMLCSTWQRIDAASEHSSEKRAALNSLAEIISCQFAGTSN